MTWSVYEFKQADIADFLKRSDLPPPMRTFISSDSVPTAEWFTCEYMQNDNGVWIQPWGSSVTGWFVLFRYWKEDIRVRFEAWRTGDRDSFALGPACKY
jgi:hypothetical protein